MLKRRAVIGIILCIVMISLPPGKLGQGFFQLTTDHWLLTTVSAQSATATLGGIVVDERGAVVPEVTITVINTATRLQRQGASTSDGYFTFLLLPPGVYTVRAQRDGFSPVQIPDLALNVGDQRAIQIQLKVGKMDETVTVQAENSVQESAAVGTVVDRQFVANLPLNGRSFNALIALTPGVVQTRATVGSPGQFSVNGQRANANYFTVDGVSANVSITPSSNHGGALGGALPALTTLGGTNNLVSIDALQEFKVLTSTYAPEFGRTPGGQISLITRAGTNDFHGGAFDYFRNDVFDAKDWFANRDKLRKPPLRQNDFGGTFSGPVFLPRFGEGGPRWYNGRNRTFFFFSYEGLRLRQPQVVSNAEVPSLSLRQSAPPQLQPYLNAFARPTGADLGNGLALISASYSNPTTLNATSLRLDHTFSQSLTVFGRYNEAPSKTVTRASANLSSPFSTILNTRTFTAGATLLLSSKVSNDFRANYSKVKGQLSIFLDDFGGAVPVSAAQLFPSFASPDNSQVSFGFGFSTRPEIRLGANTANFQRQLNLVDTFSVVTGNHQWKFGIDYRRLAPLYGPSNYFQQALFNDAAAVNTATASILTTQASQTARLSYTNFSAFAQDTWRFAPRLTLTYGMRWEVAPPASATDGNDQYTALGIENPATATLAPRGTPLYDTTFGNFAPRVGLAYRLRSIRGWETILRGGAGVFYDLGSSQSSVGFTGFPFFSGVKQTPNVPYPATGPAVEPPPYPTPPFAPPISGVLVYVPGFKLPRAYQWNFALEQSLGAHQTISASYVAAVGRQLTSHELLQNPNPSFLFLTIIGNKATSDYHALQLQFQRRLSRGLQALASYTWSHAIDKVSTDGVLILERSSADFDLRHNFSAALSYHLPSPIASGVGRALLGNWSVETIIRAQSATPVNLVGRASTNIAGQFVAIRPDLIPGVPLYLEDPLAPGGKRFNPAAFAVPPATRQGTLGRNVLRGFPLNQTDFSLRRQFNLSERLNLQFRADVFNLFNHPNFADPVATVMSTATFGRSTAMFSRGLGAGGSSGGFNPLYQVGGPRSMQFSLKLQF
ncbi:MAG: carboxypeptidase regulatory-like domain-containing protein [Blastocatellia bacterium]